jgi:hypothetical protein
MWSMIRRPGESRIEIVAAWDWAFEDAGEVRTNL